MKVAIQGLQYGDEGKASIDKALVHYSLFLPDGEGYHAVFRYNGGCNSGQTTIGRDGKELRSHIVPIGIEFEDVYSAFLSGGVVHPEKVMDEIRGKQERGYAIEPGNFGISGNAQVTLLYHINEERKIECRRGDRKFGSTMNGIAPTYSGAALKQNIRMVEFCNPESFEIFLKEKVKEGLISPEEVGYYVSYYQPSQAFLKPFLVRQDSLLREYQDRHVVAGGAQSVGLDIWDGTVPYTSSSSLIRLPFDVDKRLGVLKMVMSRVGSGPFITEIDSPALQTAMRGEKGEIDAEYGKSTGRPRRIGHFDAVFGRYAVGVAGINGLVLTKFDQLARMAQQTNGKPGGKLLVCTAYRYKGEKLKELPADRYVLGQCNPVYEEVPGWTDFDRVNNAREFSDLPRQAREYVKRHVCGPLECDWDIISVGPGVEEKIIRT